MIDRSIADLCPEMRAKYQRWASGCAIHDLRVGLSETYRSSEDQDADYAKGRTAPGPVITNARGGQSPHNCVDENGNPASKAFDFFMYADASGNRLDWDGTDERWQKAIAVGEALGLVSGETFPRKDYAHLELPNWRDA